MTDSEKIAWYETLITRMAGVMTADVIKEIHHIYSDTCQDIDGIVADTEIRERFINVTLTFKRVAEEIKSEEK